MTITAINKASVFDSANASSYATGSQTPTANRYQIAKVVNARTGTPTTPSLSGNGMTWTPLTGASYVCDNVDPQFLITIFVAKTGSSPSAGAVTASFSGVSQTGCIIIVDELDGVDISGTDLAAIIQSKLGSVNGSGTSESIVLDAAITSGNASYGAFHTQFNSAFTPGNGHSLLLEGSHTGPVSKGGTIFKGAGSQTVDVSWSTSAAKGGIALEIKAASGGSPATIVMDTATITVDGVFLDVIPGSISKALNTATLNSSGVFFDVVPGSISKALNTALLNSAGVILDIIPGEISKLINTAIISSNGISLDVVPGIFSVTLNSATLNAVGVQLNILPGQKTTQLDTAILNAIGQIIGVGSVPAIVVNLNTALLVSNGQALDVIPGLVSVILDTSILISSGVSIDLVPGGSLLVLDTALLTMSAISIDPIPGGSLLVLDTALLTLNGVSINLQGPLIAVVREWTLHDRSTIWNLPDRDTDWSLDER